MTATRAEIKLSHLRHNIQTIRKHIGNQFKICMAVKADAYGHGAIKIAQTAIQEGVEVLGVATVAEGLELRQAGFKTKILLFSLPLPQNIKDIVKWDLIPFCASEDKYKKLETEAYKQKKCLEIHIKIDTGMGRIGCTPQEAPYLAHIINTSKNLKLGGICTHFPVADISNKSFTHLQIKKFEHAIQKIKSSGINVGIIHAANSGAIIDKPESYFNMVRPGIILYGYYPSHKQKRILKVKPVMELKTKIIFLKKVPPDTPISYGMTYKTKQETHIATLPVGYGDGYSRLLSNRAQVLIKGKRYPVAGRVCMDQTMVDLGLNSNIKLYDDVTLFGADNLAPDAEELADIMGTIPYEVTCLITKRVPRIYLGD